MNRGCPSSKLRTTCLIPRLRDRPFETDRRIALCFGGRDALDNLQAFFTLTDSKDGQDLRGVEKVARAFLGRAGLPTDHLLRHTQME